MFGDSRQYAELGQTTFDGGEERVISNIDSEEKHCHVTRVPSLLPSVYTFLSYNLPSLLKWNKSPQVQVSRSELYVSKPPVLNNLSSYSLDKGFTIDTEKNDKATQKARVIWDELCSSTK